MTIQNRIEVPYPQGFREGISKCGNICDIAKVVQQAFMIDGIPGFSETSIGAQGEVPVPDKCTIILLKGSIQLDDENEDIIETFVGLQTKGSKTLKVKAGTTVVWLPSVCCWDSSECPLARKGQCRQAPGVVIARDPKKPKLWWEDTKSGHKLSFKMILNMVREFMQRL